MATLIRKFGRIITKVSKRPHAENLRIAARIPRNYHKLRNQAVQELMMENRKNNLENGQYAKEFILNKNGSQFIHIKSENTGLKGLGSSKQGDFSKLKQQNFSHRLSEDNSDTDDFSLETLSECESVIVEDHDGFKEDGLMNQDIKQFLRFVVKKVSNNSRVLKKE